MTTLTHVSQSSSNAVIRKYITIASGRKAALQLRPPPTIPSASRACGNGDFPPGVPLHNPGTARCIPDDQRQRPKPRLRYPENTEHHCGKYQYAGHFICQHLIHSVSCSHCPWSGSYGLLLRPLLYSRMQNAFCLLVQRSLSVKSISACT